MNVDTKMKVYSFEAQAKCHELHVRSLSITSTLHTCLALPLVNCLAIIPALVHAVLEEKLLRANVSLRVHRFFELLGQRLELKRTWVWSIAWSAATRRRHRQHLESSKERVHDTLVGKCLFLLQIMLSHHLTHQCFKAAFRLFFSSRCHSRKFSARSSEI